MTTTNRVCFERQLELSVESSDHFVDKSFENACTRFICPNSNRGSIPEIHHCQANEDGPQHSCFNSIHVCFQRATTSAPRMLVLGQGNRVDSWVMAVEIVTLLLSRMEVGMMAFVLMTLSHTDQKRSRGHRRQRQRHPDCQQQFVTADCGSPTRSFFFFFSFFSSFFFLFFCCLHSWTCCAAHANWLLADLF